jgi:membrane-associated phospholipid phosphatase
MLSASLGLTAEALVGYWTGDVTPPVLVTPDPLKSLETLQPDARALVLDHEAVSLFSTRPVAEGVFAIHAAPGPVVTLTPPEGDTLAAQMHELRSAMDLRADRLPEIMAQQGDMLSFFGAQQSLSNERRRRTMFLLGAAYGAVVSQEMRMKHFCSIPRPIDLSPQIQPVIQTPGHSAYPSGHATEAFAFATVLAALRLSRDPAAQKAGIMATLLAKLTTALEGATAADPDMMLFRLAARIADNRTVAGVHYPVDSAHGALLGFGTGLVFVAHCLGGGQDVKVPTWTARGTDWSGDFTLRKWIAHLGTNAWRGEDVTLPASESWHVLPKLWMAASAEW